LIDGVVELGIECDFTPGCRRPPTKSGPARHCGGRRSQPE
jgi:hypothetical protein